MTKFEELYLTNAGLEMVCGTGLARITFTRAVTGSGLFESKEDILEMIQLKDQKQEFGLEGFTKGEDNTVNVKFKVQNAGLSEAYQLSEIGIYAKGDDDEEKLYCVAYAADGNAETVPAEDSSSIEYSILFNVETIVSADANVDVIYSEDHEWVTEYVGDILGKINVQANGTVAQQIEAVKNQISATNNEMYQQLTGYTDQKIADLINGAPNTLDTLGEIADAMQDNSDVVAALEAAIGSKANAAEMDTMINQLSANKVDKVSGKGLSSNDYTTAEKNKLSGIASEADVNVQSDWDETDSTSDAFIKNKPVLTTYSDATTNTSGLMTAADKVKLNGIATGANKYVHPNTEGYKHIPSGGYNGNILIWTAKGTAVWQNPVYVIKQIHDFYDEEHEESGPDVTYTVTNEYTKEVRTDLYDNAVVIRVNVYHDDSFSYSDNDARYIFENHAFYGYKYDKNRIMSSLELGSYSNKWSNIYAVNGTIQTSDRNEKHDIAPLPDELINAFIMGLKPSSYKMNAGTSGRTHWGLISQDIEELMKLLGMDSTDFGGFIKSPKVIIVEEEEEYEDKDENGEIVIKKRNVPKEQVEEGEFVYSLRYDEFIPPLIRMVQIHANKIQNLEEDNKILKQTIQVRQSKIESLEQRIADLEKQVANIVACI